MTPSTFPDTPARHRAVLATPPRALPPEQRPTPGPIAVLPRPKSRFVAAVEAAGGTVAPLGPDTRGVVWLSDHEAAGFAEMLAEHPAIEWVQLPWAGVDSFAEVLRSSDRERLVWTSAKGAYAQPVAEHALTLALALLRQLPERVRATSWGEKAGASLYGRHVVIVGAGGIALELLRLLQPFGVTSTVVRRAADPVPGADRTVSSDRLLEVLPDADVVVLAAASTPDTARMLGAGEFAAMKSSAVLVNVARGRLVDTDALVDALRTGGIAGAGLDVTDPEPLPDGHPLWDEPTAIITPHSADTPEMTAPLLAERVRQNVTAFLGTGEFAGIVDPTAGY